MISAIQLVQGLSNVPDLLNEAHVSFSQGGEDFVADVLLRNETQKGVFLDIGAYHPYRFSNTMLLYLKGWRGINVDGNPHAIELFKQFRGDEININALVSDKEEEVKFFRFKEGAWNTTNAEAAAMLNARGNPESTVVETTVLNTVPVSVILDNHVGNRKFDLLNIDVEGLDQRILFGIDFSKYRPKVIIIEVTINDWSSEPFKSFLKVHRYSPVAQCINSAIFLRDD